MIVRHDERTTLILPAGHRLTVVADSVATGSVARLGDSVGESSLSVSSVPPSTTKTFGPFPDSARFSASSVGGSLTITMAYFVGPWGSADILGALRMARAKYSFAVDGGAISTIAPLDSDTIPDNAIILGGQINSTTACVGATATIAVGTSAGSSTTSIKAATAVTSYSADALLSVVPTFAAALKLTAAGTITFTIATAPLTAGVIEVFLFYVVAAA